MTVQGEPAASDVSEQTEQVQPGSEQLTSSTAEPSFADALLRTAIEDGHVIGPQPKADADDKAEPEEIKPSEAETVTKAEPEVEVEAEPEAKPEAKKGDEWPPSAKERVAEETAKRKRANERAEKAEALVAQFQAQLAHSVAPQPTEDNPFLDVQDINKLDSLERSYEKTIDLADENPDGAVDVVIGRDKDGKEIRKDFTPEELVVLRKKADKAIRKFIPEHRTYLQQRAVADAQALEVYPELTDSNTEFYKAAGFLAQQLMSGRAQKAPDVLVWIARAVKGYQVEMQHNGNGAEKSVTTPAAKRIVESSKTQIAPAPVKTRSFVERRTSSASVEKAKTKFEESKTPEAGEEYLAAIFSQRGGNSNRLEPIAE